MTDDLIARLDAAIGGPDRRRKDGARLRKMTPLKVETQLLLDAKAEIEELRRQRDAYANEITGAMLPANERLREEIERLQAQEIRFRAIEQAYLDAAMKDQDEIERLRSLCDSLADDVAADRAGGAGR